MSKNNSATKGFAILSVAGILNKILSVIYIPVLIRIVGDLGYGIYSAGYTIYQFIYVLTNSGFPIGISKLMSELLAYDNYRDVKRGFRIIKLAMATYGLTMAVLTAVFAKQITVALHYNDSYLVILALSPTMLFSAFSCAYRGLFNGSTNMKPTAMSQIIEQFLNVTLSLAFAFILRPKGIVFACAGATVGTTLGSLGSALYLRAVYGKEKHKYNLRTPDNIEPLEAGTILRRLLSYAVPIAFNSIVVFGGNIVDLWNTKLRLLVAGFPEKAATVKYGVLTKYTSLLNVPLAITAAMYIAVMPHFSRAVALNDSKQLKDHINSALRTSLMISIPAAVGLCILSKPVFILLFSQKYLEGWNLMAIGSVVIILVSIVQIQAGILQAVNKTRLSTIALIAGIIAKIFVNYLLIAIPSINIKGAVIGTIICYAVAIYINSKYIKKYVHVKVTLKKHMGRPIVASAVMAAVVGLSYKVFYPAFHRFTGLYIANALATIIAVLAGVLVYGIVMYIIGGITADDLSMIPYGRKLKKLIPSHKF